MYDPDAPTGSGFWHWILVDIPGTTTELAAGAGSTPSSLQTGTKVVAGTDLLNTGAAGAGGYGGPCPPFGVHGYKFTLYALSVDNFYAAAGIMPTFTAAIHGFALNHGLKEAGKVLGKAGLGGLCRAAGGYFRPGLMKDT
jgi:Raf kinase inhibitor-like YbhB/YbcL family protein